MKLLWLYGAIVFLTYGCTATGPQSGLCAILPVGQNEQGVMFVRFQCQPE